MPDADVEIVEKHHNRKLDAPSGTALLLANEIKKVKTDAEFVCGRAGMAKREENEIGIHAIRGGGTIGVHEIIITTDSQTITLSHEAHTRELFAEGAISAAAFVGEMPCGFYNMYDMIK
jgi:4-hydroxy-tetrahydrodipicolinate reductase